MGTERGSAEVVRQQLVLGCTAIHEQHGYQSDASHDCHAPEADEALRSLTSRLSELQRENEKAEDARAMLAVEAFTAPDADWLPIIDSLRFRHADALARLSRLEEALKRIAKLGDGWFVEVEDGSIVEPGTIASTALDSETDPMNDHIGDPMREGGADGL